MRFHSLTRGEHIKAVGIGAITAILLSVIMVPAFMTGISPMPKPLGLAFAETVFGFQQQGSEEGDDSQSASGQQGGQAQSQQSQAGGQQGGKSRQSSGQGGKGLPLPVGLLFHVAYVTFWSWAYVVLFRDRLTFSKALALVAVLWAIVLVAIFPLVGWGFLGLGVSPKLIIASAVPHLLFAIFLWGLCRIGFRRAAGERARTA